MFERFTSRFVPTLFAGVSLAVIGAACNSSSSSSSSSASDTFPTSLAVASPTAANVEAAIKINPLIAAATLVLPADSSFADEPFAEKVDAIEGIANGDSLTDCRVSLPPFGSATDPSCYGPALDYQNQPDGSPTSGQLPTGDLGIWTAEEGSISCVAAKINALMRNSANYVDYAMHLGAAFVCLMRNTATAFPDADGESVDLTTAFAAAILVNNANTTVTSATVENLADVDDSGTTRDVLKYTFIATDNSGVNSITVSAYMKYMKRAGDDFAGRLWVHLSGIPNNSSARAVSLSYQKTGTTLRVHMIDGNYNSSSSQDLIFDTTGALSIDGPWTGNLAQTFQEIDSSTGLGNFSYAWQAGTGDSHARIFNGFTVLGSGCGFFGYGQRFDNSGGTASDNVIDGMICNWAGGGNNHNMTTTSNLAQKQCFTFDATTGEPELDSTKNKITFAPVNACQDTGSFQVKLTSAGSYSDAANAHDLVNLTTDTDFASYTAPTAPSLPSGF